MHVDCNGSPETSPPSFPWVADVVELCVKALDRDGNSQPERVGSIWNFRGMNNKYVSRPISQQVHD